MFGFGSSSPVAEYEASGSIERVYHEIQQTLRVSGVNLNFRTWAGHSHLLPVLWQAIQPVAETWAFEKAVDELRASAAHAAPALGRLNALEHVQLGESQAYQLQAALDLYHYVNPKLLLLTAGVRLALDGEAALPVGASKHDPLEKLQLGAPPQMFPMEMVDEKPEEAATLECFKDIKQTLSLKSVNSDYRTLALWPNYLLAAWSQLKPIATSHPYHEAADMLRQRARTLARGLPRPVLLDPEQVSEAGANVDEAMEITKAFEELLPGLILNVALCLQDWRSEEQLGRSPFPANKRVTHKPTAAQVSGGNR